MSKCNRKAKHDANKNSRSSSSTPHRRREQQSESDSRSECHVVRGRKAKVTSPDKEKRTSVAQKVKTAIQRIPLSPAKKLKQTGTPPPVPEAKKQSKSDTDENLKKSKEISKSLSDSNEMISTERMIPSFELHSLVKPIRSERSLIGLDGETEMETEKKVVVKKAAKKWDQSQEESSASETKDSISLADDEETREAYRKLFKEFALGSQKLTIDDFKQEFNQLPPDPGREQCQAFNAVANVKKNRYTNISCLDVSRVPLTFMANKTQPGSDYIHANYIRSQYLKRDYILTQGPKKETIADFWRMIWQEKTTAIVMLCQFVETQREKCVEYFPRDGNHTLRFDKLTLTHEESTVNKSMVTTRLRLYFLGESRLIHHFQWKDWPDYQVPGSSEMILKILRKVRARSTPPVIHCAAGVGRSGTLMAVEIALQAINIFFKLPDIKQIVTDLRMNSRASAVQTVQQYMLIWKVVLDFGVSNKLISEESVGKFASTYRRSHRNANSS